MNTDEVLKVLRVAAEYDDRRVTAEMAVAWHQVIGRYDVQDAVTAVVKHYSEATERIMPAHVRKLIPAARDERLRLEGRRAAPLALPSRFENDAERDERMAAGAAKVQQMINKVLAKRAVTGDEAWSADPKLKDLPGAWWENPARRERHAVTLLANAGKLHQHCRDESCQQCTACPCADIQAKEDQK